MIEPIFDLHKQGTIEKTHPSLKRYLELMRVLCTVRFHFETSAEDFVSVTDKIDTEIQKHTIDKTVLKEVIDKLFDKEDEEEKVYRNILIKELGLE